MDATNKCIESACDYKSGQLNKCAPLASTYVPPQQEACPRYGNNEALMRGTLFPGLDLPFMNMVNKNHPYEGTPLGEVMALDFIVKELGLYLDTHKDDKQAFGVFVRMSALKKEARERYVKKFGPICKDDVALFEEYTWMNEPWPWEYFERNGEN